MDAPVYYTNVDADPLDADVVWVNNLVYTDPMMPVRHGGA